MTDPPERAGAVLTIDLAAIAANWQQLRDRAHPADCAAVVKADGYGLGASRVAPALARAGCQTFFVAHLDEGIVVRRALDEAVCRRKQAASGREQTTSCNGPRIFVLNGAPSGCEPEFSHHRLCPVLNSLGDIDAWAAFARRQDRCLDACIHIDTGMSRLGLPPGELHALASNPSRLGGLHLTLVMSHLACADEPAHPLNGRQLDAFRGARGVLPPAPGSLANSSGIFLGSPYHADLVRPGAALYGVAPLPELPNPMAQVVQLKGKILQVREIDSGASVGYGASHRARRSERIATVAVGYADGYLRALSNRGVGIIGGQRVPLVGRVSMDLITFDVTDIPEAAAHPGAFIELVGPDHPVDAVALDAGTIAYEILTSLGRRYHRLYVPSEG